MGELVIVHLAGSGTMRWSAIERSQSGRILVRRSGSLSPDGTSAADFEVVHAGLAMLSASGRPICTHDAACPQFIVLWRVSVIAT